MIRLAHFFNKNILACIPSLFDDQRPRRFKLVGIEESGLWLEGEDLTMVFQTEEQAKCSSGVATAFFPYAQIAYVIPEVNPLAITSVALVSPQSREPGGHRPEKPGKGDQEKKHRGTEPKKKK